MSRPTPAVRDRRNRQTLQAREAAVASRRVLPMGLVGPSSTGAYADFCYRLAVRFLTSHGGPEDLALARSRYTLTAAEHGLTVPGARDIRQAAFRAAASVLGVPWILNAPPFWRSAEEIESARSRDLNDWTTPVAA